MPISSLGTYLNDHLAGSVVALEYLDHLEASRKGSTLATFASSLRKEIAEDQKVLEALMADLKITQSVARKAAGWISEKLVEVKLYLDDASGGPLKLLEGLEAISLGIEGKRLLWRSLSAASDGHPDLAQLDFAQLIARAERQRDEVERIRIQAATSAFQNHDTLD